MKKHYRSEAAARSALARSLRAAARLAAPVITVGEDFERLTLLYEDTWLLQDVAKRAEMVFRPIEEYPCGITINDIDIS